MAWCWKHLERNSWWSNAERRGERINQGYSRSTRLFSNCFWAVMSRKIALLHSVLTDFDIFWFHQVTSPGPNTRFCDALQISTSDSDACRTHQSWGRSPTRSVANQLHTQSALEQALLIKAQFWLSMLYLTKRKQSSLSTGQVQEWSVYNRQKSKIFNGTKDTMAIPKSWSV